MLIDLPTREELAAYAALLHEVREELRGVRALLARPADEELTLDEVAARTKHSVKTVRKWIKEGKYAPSGQLIKLQTIEYAEGFARVPLAALLAFGRSQAFDLTQLATTSSPLPGPVLDSRKALRKAS